MLDTAYETIEVVQLHIVVFELAVDVRELLHYCGLAGNNSPLRCFLSSTFLDVTDVALHHGYKSTRTSSQR